MSEKILIPYHDAADRIRSAIEEGQILNKRSIKFSIDLDEAKRDFNDWSEKNEDLLNRIFSTDEEAKKYKSCFSPVLKERFYLFDKAKDFRDLVDSKIRYLETIVSRLTIVTEIDIEHGHGDIFAPSPDVNKVFIVHGKKKCRDSVELLLRKQEMEAVILKDKNKIVEKLGEHPDVEFAVVFVTNEDMGAVKTKKDKLKPRAGQNVILALGYLMGRFGRECLIVLTEKDIELPSDLSGIVCLCMDSEGWRDELVEATRSFIKI